MAPRKQKQKKSEIDTSIEVFLKKNRVCSKATQTSNDDIDKIDYVKQLIDKLNLDENIKYLIIQDGIHERKYERYFYTNDNYCIIISEQELFNSVMELDFSIYENLHISSIINGEFKIIKDNS